MSELPGNDPMPMDDEEFEKNLKEIMEDVPNLNDSSNTVQSGSPQKIMTQSAYAGSVNSYSSMNSARGFQQNQMTRSYTAPASSSVGGHNNSDFVPRKATLPQTAQTKLENIKAWSINTYKCTRQFLSERLGKSAKTVDLELETQIENLRDMQRKYANILRLSRALTNHFFQVVQTQRALGEAFSEQAQKSPELHEEFTYNCETQRALVKNGETLLGAMNFFTSSVNTLCHKTMEDTLLTVKNYETARLEYDAYRSDLDVLSMGPRDTTSPAKIDEARKKFEVHKEKFERLKGDVSIKLKFLDENRVKVMHKQLLLLHNAVSAYFSGNQAALEATLKQFSIKLKSPNSDEPSWLEK
ncbi:hypothetical protein CHS0354_019551 [Potamilus streckersoni]|uniref:AH domain-containing protein n=1 Tax=Potamilus streckersoni TaxID=2493646 RepID=A0AAE0VVR8_9BIVA|nr:hypothetical protein CHS0354_019551 [Potamilus streckersoni]